MSSLLQVIIDEKWRIWWRISLTSNHLFEWKFELEIEFEIEIESEIETEFEFEFEFKVAVKTVFPVRFNVGFRGRARNVLESGRISSKISTTMV